MDRPIATQEENFRWFVEHYTDIFSAHGECWVVIYDKKIEAVCGSVKEAYEKAAKMFPMGSYNIQHCNGDESGYTAYIM